MSWQLSAAAVAKRYTRSRTTSFEATRESMPNYLKRRTSYPDYEYSALEYLTIQKLSASRVMMLNSTAGNIIRDGQYR
ncbi:hypothetical protein PUN28_018794 [Cardiocondyla obscurior]|uniref:Uncharacterized protein n=1 Tax=Cardiocondyla obscurior TaxID=286306 RepID=A0AAW2EC00_9HYME